MLHERGLVSAKKPCNSSGDANTAATAALQGRAADPAERPKKEEGECKHRLHLQGNVSINSDLMLIVANERTPAGFGIGLQVRRNVIIRTSLLITTKRIVLCHHQSWQYC